MSEITSYSEVRRSSERSFGFTFAIVFALVGLLPLKDGLGVRPWALGVTAALVLVASVAPRILRPFNVIWFKFGMMLSAIVSPIVMSIVFVLAVMPTAIVLKAMGADPLHRKIDRGARSYWIERDRELRTGSMRNQF